MEKRVETVEFPGYAVEEYQLFKLATDDFDSFYDRVAELCSAYFPVVKGDPPEVCDLGCGDGILTHKLLSRREDLRVTAVDLDPAAAELARESLRGWSQLRAYEVICADALDYLRGLPQGSLDIVVSVWAMHNMLTTHRDEVLAAAFTALKPGGLFVNGDKYALHGEAHQHNVVWQIQRYFAAWQPLRKHEFLKSWVLHMIADESSERIMRESDARRTMTALGYADLAVVHRNRMDAILVARKPA